MNLSCLKTWKSTHRWKGCIVDVGVSAQVDCFCLRHIHGICTYLSTCGWCWFIVINSVTYWCQDPTLGPVGKQTNKRIAYGLGFRFRASALRIGLGCSIAIIIDAGREKRSFKAALFLSLLMPNQCVCVIVFFPFFWIFGPRIHFFFSMIRRLSLLVSVMSFVHRRAERRVDGLQATIVEILAAFFRRRMQATSRLRQAQGFQMFQLPGPLKRTIIRRYAPENRLKPKWKVIFNKCYFSWKGFLVSGRVSW